MLQPGNNEAGICNLEHCGNTLCDQSQLDQEGKCRVETWATPFRIRVAFGPGQDTGTTLEDNIGMCLMYEQLPCMSWTDADKWVRKATKQVRNLHMLSKDWSPL